jgi:hypothetical protein
VTSKPRGSMDPQELLEARRRAKHNTYMKDTGRPVIITHGEAHILQAHLRRLVSTGMAATAIAKESGVSATAVRSIVRGAQSRAFRTNFEALMKVRPDPMSYTRPREGRAIAVWPARRRLQALVADGFPYIFLARQAGMKSYRNSQWYRIIGGHDCEYTSPYYIRLAFELYDKLAGTKPYDHGLTHRQVSRTLTFAAKYGYAPSWCWDTDTIDRADAIPDWTGGPCGTLGGYRLHRKYRTPACRPCLNAAKGET